MTSRLWLDDLAERAPVAVRLELREGVEETVLERVEGVGGERTAHFRSLGAGGVWYPWEAYRYQGRWAYGTGADRLRLLEVLT